MDVDADETDETEHLPAKNTPDLAHLSARATSHVPLSPSRRPPAPLDRDAGSDANGGDPALRRRLGELNKRYDALEARYRDLRDVAAREAEHNFDQLRRQADEKAAAAGRLVASLKAELAALREQAWEGQRLRGQLQASEARADSLQAEAAELAAVAAAARAEAKALSAKLAASRAAEAAAAARPPAAVPGSAIKAGIKAGGAHHHLRPNEAAQHQSAQMHMKEDLYGDLTGLIVRAVKKEGGEDVFDCLQTGRNGTLHFKLSITNDAASDKYDDAQYLYTPQLDPGRDRELVDMLPDYLVEEISFPRAHAAKFYARVIKSLME